MSNEVAVKDNIEAGLPAIPEEYTGYEGMDVSAFVVPRMKLCQPMSKEGTAGKFRLNLTGEEFATIKAAVLKMNRGRIWWNKDDLTADEPLCRSLDFMKPDPRIPDPPDSRCADMINGRLTQVCIKSKWIDGERPPCHETFNMLCLDLQTEVPFWISVHGKSISGVRKFLSSIALRKKKLFDFRTVLYSEEKKEPTKHFVLCFEPPVPIEDDIKPLVYAAVQEFHDVDIAATYDAEEAVKTAGAEGGSGGDEEPDWVKEG